MSTFEVEVQERFTAVESALAEFIIQTNKGFRILQNEMKDFKDEKKDLKDETKDFKDNSAVLQMQFAKERLEDRQEHNKRWAELANKMGTIVKDIIVPAVRPIVLSFFKEEVSYLAVNVKKNIKSLQLKGEFDVIAATDSYIFLVETKSSPSKDYILKFKSDVVPRFRQMFPEFDTLTLVPIFASIRFEEELIQFGTNQGIYMMAYREWEYMDLLNFDKIGFPGK